MQSKYCRAVCPGATHVHHPKPQSQGSLEARGQPTGGATCQPLWGQRSGCSSQLKAAPGPYPMKGRNRPHRRHIVPTSGDDGFLERVQLGLTQKVKALGAKRLWLCQGPQVTARARALQDHPRTTPSGSACSSVGGRGPHGSPYPKPQQHPSRCTEGPRCGQKHMDILTVCPRHSWSPSRKATRAKSCALPLDLPRPEGTAQPSADSGAPTCQHTLLVNGRLGALRVGVPRREGHGRGCQSPSPSCRPLQARAAPSRPTELLPHHIKPHRARGAWKQAGCGATRAGGRPVEALTSS